MNGLCDTVVAADALGSLMSRYHKLKSVLASRQRILLADGGSCLLTEDHACRQRILLAQAFNGPHLLSNHVFCRFLSFSFLSFFLLPFLPSFFLSFFLTFFLAVFLSFLLSFYRSLCLSLFIFAVFYFLSSRTVEGKRIRREGMIWDVR